MKWNGNGTEKEYLSHKGVQESYDGQSCSWQSSLTIPEISHELAGLYYCGMGGKEENVTISVRGIQLMSVLVGK